MPETGIIRPVTDDEAARLAPEVARLLRVVPETWGTFDMAAMTAAQERALWLLTAAEMVERRLRFRVSMATAPTSLEAVLTATGGEGFAKAMEPLLAKAWSLWEERFKAWNAGDARETTPFIVESVPPREWRLTESGVLARNDHDAGNTGGIDFVLWRGSFDGRPRRTPDGRVFARPEVVRGSGRVERLIEHVVGPELPRVNTANWPEGADAIAGRLVPELTANITEYFKAHAPAAPANMAAPVIADDEHTALAKTLKGKNLAVLWLLHDRKAVSAAKARKRASIAAAIGIEEVDVKNAMTALRKIGNDAIGRPLVDSGDSGSYLTADGCAVASRIAPSDVKELHLTFPRLAMQARGDKAG